MTLVDVLARISGRMYRARSRKDMLDIREVRSLSALVEAAVAWWQAGLKWSASDTWTSAEADGLEPVYVAAEDALFAAVDAWLALDDEAGR